MPTPKLLAGIAVMTVVACAHTEPPPDIAYDADAFAAAVREAEPPRPVRIVEVPKPLPLPGQLKPLPKRSPEGKEAETPQERVHAANAAARIEPTKAGYINAVQVYPYAEGALYQLYAAPGQVSDVALRPGERLVSVSAGDTVRWVLGDTTSGAGAGEQVHILVKPIAAGLATNLLIATDQRAYRLELQSAEDTYMASVSWTYPHQTIVALRARNARAEQAEAVTVDDGLDLRALRFRYAVTGDTPPWRPLRAFDDGARVYIQFPAAITRGEAPPLFVVGPTGDSQLVNYRVRGSYYIVERLFAAAELRLGAEPQQVVRVARSDTEVAGR